MTGGRQGPERSGPSARRRAALLLALAVAGFTFLLPVSAAHAQDEGAVGLTLSTQTPFATPKAPEVSIEILARNDGIEALEGVSLRATIWSQVTSLGAYESSLVADPVSSAILATPSRSIDGTIEPGQTRRLRLEFRMVAPGISRSQSYVYPLKLELFSGGTSVGELRSSIVFVVRAPQTPVGFSTRVSLESPLLMNADGVFVSDELERAIAPGGGIGTTVAALRENLSADRPVAVDLVLSPVLLLQLEGMRGGYQVIDGDGERVVEEGAAGSAAAARTLAALRTIAGSDHVEVTAWPLAVPTIPSLLDRLSRDLPVQIVRGRALTARLLGVRPAAGVSAPPRSAVTQDAIDRLAAAGAGILLLDPAAVPPEPQTQGFAPPAVVRVPVSDQGADPVASVIPDEGAGQLLSSDTARSNPVLAAQQAFGELAAIWLEQPGIPRSLATALPVNPADGALVPAMLRRIAQAPFLAPATASQLVNSFPPPASTSTFEELDDRTFSPGYASSIKHSRRLIETYRSVLVHPSTEPKRLRTRLLLMEGVQFLDDEVAGQAQIGAVDDRVNDFLGRIAPVAAPLVTLSSRRGTIPVQITNDTGQPVRVRVQLVSQHLAVGNQEVRSLVVANAQRSIEFDVELGTTGEFPVQVRVLAPSGRPISDTTIAVRSTAYNRIALIITIGAAIALLLLWGRRFLPSRRKT